MATISTINVGSLPNDGTGDNRREAFQKANANFGAVNTDLEAAEADITTLQNDTAALQVNDANNLRRDGSNSPSANISLNGFKLTDAGAATAAADLAPLSAVQSGVSSYILTTGSGSAYVAAFSPAITSVTRGMRITIEVHTDNTGPCTLTVNGLSAVTMRDHLGQELPPGEIQGGTIEEFWHNGSQWRMTRKPEAPAGTIRASGVSSEDSGWVFGYGQDLSRTTYARLFAVFGTTHGAGDGSTTFGTPDLRGRVIAGRDFMGGTPANRLTGQSGGIDGDILGNTGGDEEHTLVTSEMPVHTHTGTTNSDGDHNHGLLSNSDGSLSDAIVGLRSSTAEILVAHPDTSSGYDTDNSGSDSWVETDGDHTHGFTTNSRGGDEAHNNIQPTIIMNYVIKV